MYIVLKRLTTRKIRLGKIRSHFTCKMNFSLTWIFFRRRARFIFSTASRLKSGYSQVYLGVHRWLLSRRSLRIQWLLLLARPSFYTVGTNVLQNCPASTFHQLNALTEREGEERVRPWWEREKREGPPLEPNRTWRVARERAGIRGRPRDEP